MVLHIGGDLFSGRIMLISLLVRCRSWFLSWCGPRLKRCDPAGRVIFGVGVGVGDDCWFVVGVEILRWRGISVHRPKILHLTRVSDRGRSTWAHHRLGILHIGGSLRLFGFAKAQCDRAPTVGLNIGGQLLQQPKGLISHLLVVPGLTAHQPLRQRELSRECRAAQNVLIGGTAAMGPIGGDHGVRELLLR